MKKFLYLSLVLLGVSFTQVSEAQVRVNVGVNIGNQPLWGPLGYDYVRYYYMPEINVYYNVVNQKYTYFHKNRWVTKSKLPREYRHVDLFRTYKVVINDNDPWRHHSRNISRYGHYARNHSQIVIRDYRKAPKMDKHHGPKKNNDRYGRNDRRGRDHRGHGRG